MQLRLGLPNSVGCSSNASTVQLTHSSQLKVEALHGTAHTDTHIAVTRGGQSAHTTALEEALVQKQLLWWNLKATEEHTSD